MAGGRWGRTLYPLPTLPPPYALASGATCTLGWEAGRGVALIGTGEALLMHRLDARESRPSHPHGQHP